MAKAKVSKLPGINIDSGPMITNAKDLVSTRSNIANLQTKEKRIKTDLSDDAETLRKEQVDQGKFIGLIRLTNTELPPIRVEFRQTNGALDVSEEKILDRLFGASRPLLFEKEKIITQITDPEKVIVDLTNSGKNPWDYLELAVKGGMDRTVADSTNSVVSAEALLPKKGFLATLNDIVGTLGKEAIEYAKEYLEKTLKPSVVAGTKG